jgi:PKD repeat protein
MRIKNKIQRIYVLFVLCSIFMMSSKGAHAQCNADFELYNSPCSYLTNFVDLSTAGPGHTIISWLWDFGDGGTSTLSNPTYSYGGPGTYFVTLIIDTDLGCSDTITYINHFSQHVIADFSDSTLCDYTAYFTDLSTAGPDHTIISWTWEFGDGFYSNIQHPVHTYLVPGTYTVTLTVEADLGCYDNITYDVVIPEHIAAAFSDSSTCYNITFFKDLSTAGPNHTIISWFWVFGDGGTSSLQNPVHTYTVPGTYTATLIVEADLGCIDTAWHEIFIHEIPEANFTADTACCGTPTQFTDLSIPGEGNTIMGWVWEFGDGGFSSFQNPTYTYLDPGIYMVHLTIFSDCGCMDTVYHEVVAEDHAKVETRGTTDPQLIVYPNPLKDVAEISFKLIHPARVNVEVINTSGTVVARITDEQYQSGTHQLRWNSEDLTAGLYILKMMVGDKIYTSKLVKNP